MKQKQKQQKLADFKYNALREQMKKEAVEVATVLMMYIPVLVLRDKYGFGNKRLGDFMEYVTNTFQCLSENRLDYLDIQKAIKDETGFEIEIPNRRFI